MTKAVKIGLCLISLALAAGASPSKTIGGPPRDLEAVSSSDDILRSACEGAGFREAKKAVEAAEAAPEDTVVLKKHELVHLIKTAVTTAVQDSEERMEQRFEERLQGLLFTDTTTAVPQRLHQIFAEVHRNHY